jgi:hypothetical protein
MLLPPPPLGGWVVDLKKIWTRTEAIKMLGYGYVLYH